VSSSHESLIFRTTRGVLLTQRLKAARGTASGTAITAYERTSEELPLSPAQERVWFEHHWDESSPLYTESVLVRLQGPLDVSSVEKALHEIVRRHEILRVLFDQKDATVYQKVQPPQPHDLVYIDLSHLERQSAEAELRRIALVESQRVFNLRQGRLLRTTLLKLDTQEHALLLNVHHIVFDGWSAAIFFDELFTLYRSYVTKTAANLDELPLQYPDYAASQQGARGSALLEKQLAYWKERLGSEHGGFAILPDRPRPRLRTVRGARFAFSLEADLVESLKELGRRHEATLFMTLIGAFGVLLHRLSGESTVLIGMPSTNRDHAGIDRLIGLFVNTLVLRLDVSGDESFERLLEQTRRRTTEAFENKDLPFEQLVDELQPDRDLSRTPFFQAMFDFQRHESYQQSADSPGRLDGKPGGGVDEQTAPGLRTAFDELDNGTSKFEIGLSMRETWSGVTGEFEFNTDLFHRESIVRLAEHYTTLLQSLVKRPQDAIGELHMLTEAERELVIERFNDTSVPAENSLFHNMFEQRVLQTPDAVACRYQSDELTYADLNRRANQLAHYLMMHGCGPEVRVGVCCDRGVNLVLSILAILKAGGAYVPLDPNYPVERLRSQMDEVKLSMIVTSGMLSASIGTALASDSVRIILLDEENDSISSMSEDNPTSQTTDDNLAYIIFTSGSTGRPLGVGVEHHSLSNLAFALRDTVYSNEQAGSLRVSLNGSISFDTSIKQLVQLAFGHSLEIVPDDIRWDGESLLRFLDQKRVDVFDVTPAQLDLLIEAGLLSSRAVFPRILLIGGEAIDRNVWESLATSATRRSFNLYGPTECTVDSTICEIKQNRDCMPTIGKPIRNVRAYVLDNRLQPVPIGARGELFLAGEGVARGYIGHDDVTAQRFIASPFRRDERLYRTGDVARYRHDGHLEFLGRVDRQVKIRGFRVELEEIESTLQQHPDVMDVAVIPRGEHGEKRLVAFIAPRREASESLHGLARYRLPNDLEIVELNRNETDFLFDEVFVNRAYFKHGISLPRNSVVFDVGANIGMFTLAATIEGDGSRVFAFEPNPKLFHLAQINASLYAKNAQVFNFGLSNAARTASFTFYPEFSSLSGLYADVDSEMKVVRSFIHKEASTATGNGTHSGSGAAAKEIPLLDELLGEKLKREVFEVELRTLSEVVAEFNLENIDLLKINVEKSEFDVLQGIQPQDWPKIQQIALEVHDIDDRLTNIVSLLKGHGYSVSVEKDWRLEEKANTNFYVYASRLDKAQVTLALPGKVTRAVLTPATLHEFAESRLPQFMVPSEFVILESLPLTSNGKVDYKVLASRGKEVAPTGDCRPRTETEAKLERIWSEVLKRDSVGVNENFFQIGGHSLIATNIIARVRKATGVDLPLRTLFQTPTIAGLATTLESFVNPSGLDPLPHVVSDEPGRFAPFPLTEIQQAYWVGRGDLFDLGSVGSHAYLEIDSEGLNLDRLNKSWQRIIERHDMLRAIFLDDGRQQVLREAPAYRFKELDLSGADTDSRDAALLRVREEMSHQVLRADRWPLFEIRASRLDDQHLRLHISLDALIADARSIFRLFHEWSRYYNEPDLKLPPPAVTFRDYVTTIEGMRNGTRYARARSYWMDRLPSLPPAPQLPMKTVQASGAAPRFSRRTARLSAKDWELLKQRAADAELTTSAVLLTAYAVVLTEKSRSPHFTINLTLFNRLPLHPDIDEVIGDFTSLTLLEVNHSASDSFINRARRVQHQLWQDIDHMQFSGLGVMRAMSQRGQRGAMPVVFTSALALESWGQ
jgi:amino acid adenylation domain-containing protein/FkbM family methyltransferase